MTYTFAVEGEAENTDALEKLSVGLKKWFETLGATVLESQRDAEDVTVSFVVKTTRDLSEELSATDDLPGRVSVEPL